MTPQKLSEEEMKAVLDGAAHGISFCPITNQALLQLHAENKVMREAAGAGLTLL